MLVDSICSRVATFVQPLNTQKLSACDSGSTCSDRRPDMRLSSTRSSSACVPPNCSVRAKLGSRPPPLNQTEGS